MANLFYYTFNNTMDVDALIDERQYASSLT